MTREQMKKQGASLRERREGAGYTPERFSEIIGITTKTLQQVELGYQKLGKRSMTKALNVLEGKGQGGGRHKNDIVERIYRIMADDKQRQALRTISEAIGKSELEALKSLIENE